MSYKSLTLDVRSANETGNTSDVRGMINKAVHIHAGGGAFTATVTLEGSLDATNFIALDSTTDAEKLMTVAEAFISLRTVTTGYTSGTLAGTVAGDFPRGD